MLLPILQLIGDPEPHSAPLNMAIDEVLLKRCRLPALRLYGWDAPSISFGYFERHAVVSAMNGGRTLVRRWTGGGIVEHGDDTTYSLFVPSSETAFFEVPAPASYEAVHRALAAAMRETGLEAVMAHEPAPAISRACFENPVRHDVILAGRKIAGAAQRRTRWGMLHQGSIQRKLPADFAERFAAQLAPEIVRVRLDGGILAEAEALAEEKYATRAWTSLR